MKPEMAKAHPKRHALEFVRLGWTLQTEFVAPRMTNRTNICLCGRMTTIRSVRAKTPKIGPSPGSFPSQNFSQKTPILSAFPALRKS